MHLQSPFKSSRSEEYAYRTLQAAKSRTWRNVGMASTGTLPPGRPRRSKSSFKVGDQVRFNYMSKPVRGQIVEDRGRIGVGGSHLYRVVGKAGSITRVLELSAEELKKVNAAPESASSDPSGA